jgi:hypothetical protein
VSIWLPPVLGVAALQVLAGLLGVGWSIWSGEPLGAALPAWVFPVQMAVFSAAAAAVLLGADGDERILALGAVFALIATSFARVGATFLESQLEISQPVAAIRSLRVDALLPFFVWRFFQDFPRGITSPALRQTARIATAISGAAGLVLIGVNAVLVWTGGPEALRVLDAYANRSQYWTVVYGPTLAALPFALWKARSADREERRRAVLFASGIVGAALPISLFVLGLETAPWFARWFDEGGGSVLVLPLVELLILSIPLTIAYSVLVDRALPVRVVLRQALQYGLARGVVAVAAAVPFLWLLWSAYRLRSETLAELASGPRALAFLGATVLGLGAIRVRTRARNSIDRTFFRDRYDTRRTLVSVAERSAQVQRVGELAELLVTEVDRALHLERISVLVLDPPSRQLVPASGAVRALDWSSPLAVRLAEERAPVDVDLERRGSSLRSLPTPDRQWLVDSGARLLVPLVSSAGELIAALCLGEKRSELPFRREDKELLSAIAVSGAMALENRLRVGSGGPPRTTAGDSKARGEAVASVCEACGRLAAAGERCRDCSGALVATVLPLEPLGKFRLEQRIGQGSMGVVFRARDVELDRAVAIKTLPATTPEEAALLRREARAMAAVLHPNLALIYAVESWMGTPLLVTEFFEGGTLADRLASAGKAVDVEELGARIADALGCLHDAGVLHRDVKPSNIGLTAAGVPKLLDFGLARVQGEASSAAGVPGAEWSAETGRATQLGDSGLAGTPLYMSPEALSGEPPDASFDLWSLAILLYEVAAGRNPVERATWSETLRAIQEADVAPLGALLPGASPGWVRFFADALHRERRRRPATAREFAARWSAR